MTETRTTEFEEISQRVLRDYLRAMRWTPRDYLPARIMPAPPNEFDRKRIVERCKAIVGQADFASEKISVPEPLLQEALLLDRLEAPMEEVEAALPPTLISKSAVARLLLGRAMQRAGHERSAITMFLEAMAINPHVGAVRKAVGLALRKQAAAFDDAGEHLEASLELRSAIGPDGELNPHVAVLVARVSERVEIYLYEWQFYILRRRPDSVGVRPIGGELYDIYRGPAYSAIRFVMHIPVLRPLLLELVKLIMRRGAQAVRAEPATSVPGAASPRPSIWVNCRKFINGSVRMAVKRLAIWLFARPVEERVGTMREAMDRAVAADAGS